MAARRPVSIRLEKKLPVASGIGGGSSDAAAALRLLRDFWKLDSSDETLARLGLELGADVPMCLAASPLVARGIGDELERLERFPELCLVLVNPGVPLSTAAVFARLSSRSNPALPRLGPLVGSGRFFEWLEGTRNDLEAPARMLVPQIDEALQHLADAGAAVARMSGSGATCFGLFTSRSAAENAARAIGQTEPSWFVAATTSEAAEAGDGGN